MSSSRRTKANKANNNRAIDEEYQSKRSRNNEAVKRSREKTRQLAQETRDRLTKVTEAADRLEIEVISRRQQLQSYQNLFYKTLEKKKENGQHIDMKALCDEDDPHIAG